MLGMHDMYGCHLGQAVKAALLCKEKVAIKILAMGSESKLPAMIFIFTNNLHLLSQYTKADVIIISKMSWMGVLLSSFLPQQLWKLWMCLHVTF